MGGLVGAGQTLATKEPSHLDSSFEYPQHMFWLRNKKINFLVHTLKPDMGFSLIWIFFLSRLQNTSHRKYGGHIGKYLKNFFSFSSDGHLNRV